MTALSTPFRRVVGVFSDHLSILTVGAATFLLAWPVVGTPYVIDDVTNAQIPVGLAKGHITRWHYFTVMNDSWIRQGRFFPSSILYATFMWTTFPTRVEYKVWLLALMLGVTLGLGYWVWRALGNTAVAVIATAAMVACWQFRYPMDLAGQTYDGLTAFAGEVPWAMLLMLITGALVLRQPKRWAPGVFGLAVVVWSITVSTYEYAVLVAPALIAALWLVPSDRSWRRRAIAAIVGPALCEVGIALWLIAHRVGPPNSEYTLSFSPLPLIEGITRELIAVLPMSSYWIPGPVRPALHLDAGLVTLCVCLAIVLSAVLVVEWRKLPVLSLHTRLLLAGIGSWMWFAPAVLIGGHTSLAEADCVGRVVHPDAV